MIKYGKEYFTSYILDYAENQDELDSKESYWINYYDTFQGKGYNMTSGGQEEKSNNENLGKLRISGDKDFLVFDLNGNLLFDRKSQTAFGKEIGCNVKSVGGCLSGRKSTVKGYILIFKKDYTDKLLKDKINKVITQCHDKPDFVVYDINTNKIIGIWNNFKTCGEFLNLSSDSVRKNINGKIKNPKEYIIEYIHELQDTEKMNIYEWRMNNETKNITRNR